MSTSQGIDRTMRPFRFLYHYNLWVAVNFLAMGCYFTLLFWDKILWPEMVSLFILTWQVYTLDRYVLHPEDVLNSDLNLDQIRGVRRHKSIIRTLLILSFFCQLLLVYLEPYLSLPLVFNLLASAAYITNVPFYKKRIKCVPFLKPFYLSLVTCVTLLLYARHLPGNFPEVLMTFSFFLLFAFNVSAFDIKDQVNDLKAGIRTFANTFGARHLLLFQITVSIGWALFLLAWFPSPAPVAMSLAFLIYALLATRLRYTVSTDFLFIVVDSIGGIMALLYVLIR